MPRDQEAYAQAYRRFLCLDCGKDTYRSQEYYMLLYKIWRSIHPAIDGMLCLDCAERRLGRGLTRHDFSGARVNAGQARVCPALAERLGRGDAGRAPTVSVRMRPYRPGSV